VGRSQAAQAAQSFLASRPLNQDADLSFTLSGLAEVRTRSGRPLLYIFDLQPTGWVMVSGSDAAFPVPAYSYEGKWSPDQVPEAMQLWLGSYEAQVADALNNDARDAAHPAWQQLSLGNPGSKAGYRGVLPLLTSNWDQGYPYNQQCPSDPGGVAGHAVTGCVATACAQLMYYFRHPRQGSGSYTYYHPVYDTISMDFSSATYEWEAMTDQTTVYNEEIAEISYHFGVAVDMVYGPSSSGMYNHKAAYALRTHFGYSPETEYVFRDTTTMDWDSLLLSHIDRKIPMYYAGWAAPGSQSGHAFIADGYEVTPQGKHYHFNWGWGGTLNGYFYTNNLTPGGSQFSFMQELIVNAYPDTLSQTYPAYCSGPDTLTSRAGTIDDGSGPARDYLNGASCSWLIRPQWDPYDSIQYLIFRFKRMDTEPGTDIVKVYDGPTTSYPLIGSFSGTNLPAMFISTGNQALVTFTADAQNEAAGFFLGYESVEPDYCNSLLQVNATSGSLGDGSGDKFYNNGTLCRWLIQPPGAVNVTAHFTSFQTQQGKDQLKVYDYGTQTLLGTFSGNTLPPVQVANSGAMYLEFSTDGDVRGQGWELDFIAGGAGLDERPEEHLLVWPNPGDGQVYVKLHSATALLSIYDARGAEVGLKHTCINGDVVSFDLSHLPAGLYLLVANDGDQVLHQRLVVRK